jgi:hypothetical protein
MSVKYENMKNSMKKSFWLNSSRRCKSRSDPFKQTLVYIGVLSLYDGCNDIYKEIIMFISHISSVRRINGYPINLALLTLRALAKCDFASYLSARILCYIKPQSSLRESHDRSPHFHYDTTVIWNTFGYDVCLNKYKQDKAVFYWKLTHYS